MRRDMDLIRDLMLRLETYPVPRGSYVKIQISDDFTHDHPLAIPDFTADQIAYHLDQILLSKLIAGSRWDQSITFSGLTPAGHDFVDSVREPKVWAETKSKAAKAGGWTLGLIRDIGAAIIKGELMKHGLPIG